jgi:tetraacyldisaccharide 4'-kinase
MFNWLYGAITRARNSLYEKSVFKSYSLGVLTVSIGNITVGGTGKTPLVALVAEVLAKKGEKVCILTRGYGRNNPNKRVLVSDGEKILTEVGQAGDEPFELAQKLTGKAVVIADANRVSAGNWARERFGITCFILDDAFQHRKVRRDLDIICIDATNPFGNEKTLPSGILREPLENLKRADAIVITRANLTKDVLSLKSQISKYNRTCPIFVAENKISNLVKLEEFPTHPQKSLSQTDYRQTLRAADNLLAFCALGNPNNFFEQLRQEKFELVSPQKFPDHHFYTQKDIEKIVAQADQSGAKALLTTAKDAVKLKNLKFEVPCFVVESAMVFDGENDFRDWLLIQDSGFKIQN